MTSPTCYATKILGPHFPALRQPAPSWHHPSGLTGVLTDGDRWLFTFRKTKIVELQYFQVYQEEPGGPSRIDHVEKYTTCVVDSLRIGQFSIDSTLLHKRYQSIGIRGSTHERFDLLAATSVNQGHVYLILQLNQTLYTALVVQ